MYFDILLHYKTKGHPPSPPFLPVHRQVDQHAVACSFLIKAIGKLCQPSWCAKMGLPSPRPRWKSPLGTSGEVWLRRRWTRNQSWDTHVGPTIMKATCMHANSNQRASLLSQDGGFGGHCISCPTKIAGFDFRLFPIVLLLVEFNEISFHIMVLPVSSLEPVRCAHHGNGFKIQERGKGQVFRRENLTRIGGQVGLVRFNQSS